MLRVLQIGISLTLFNYLVRLSTIQERLSKMDSALICGDGYESESLKFRLRANAETSHSVQYNLVVMVNIVGSNKKFLYRIVRS